MSFLLPSTAEVDLKLSGFKRKWQTGKEVLREKRGWDQVEEAVDTGKQETAVRTFLLG